jgi:hypothetical protein
MAETLKCPMRADKGTLCAKVRQMPAKSELECLRSIDASVGIMQRMLIWWLVVSFLGAAAYLANRRW